MKDYLHLFAGEECGLAAAINVPHAPAIVRDMLLVQQHRGEAGVGILSSDGARLTLEKYLGRVDLQFPQSYQFPDHRAAIGHVRYPTKGSAYDPCNVQPLLVRDSNQGELALAHNGTIVNAAQLRADLRSQGAVLQSTTDSELLLQRIARSRAPHIVDAVKEGLQGVEAAYALLISTAKDVVAVRGPYGVRPLSIATYRDGYLVASETCAFRIFDADSISHVQPGEIVHFSQGNGTTRHRFAQPREHHCAFECVYFSDPRSDLNHFMHEDFRQLCGAAIYEDNKAFFDSLPRDAAVVPILDSGKQGSFGFSRASGITYKEYFMRRHNVPHASGRSYTAVEHDERVHVAQLKLDLRKQKVKGKYIITGDDSLVRGTTSRINNQRLRDAGAAYVVNLFFSPPVSNTCPLGMNHQDHRELIAHERTAEEIAQVIGADKVFFVTLGRFEQILENSYKAGFCTGCFGGKYPPH